MGAVTVVDALHPAEFDDVGTDAEDHVADIQFDDLGDARDRRDVLVMQPMPGVDHEAQIMAIGCRVHDSIQFALLRSAVRVRVATGVQFHDRGPGRHGSVELRAVRVDEHRYADAAVGEFCAGVPQLVQLARNVKAAFGSQFLAFLRHQADVRRPDTPRNRDHLVGDGHLEVHVRAHDLVDLVEIMILDVPPVFAQVHRDAVGATSLGNLRRLGRSWVAGATRLPQSGDVIDIHAEMYRVVSGHSWVSCSSGAAILPRCRLSSTLRLRSSLPPR